MTTIPDSIKAQLDADWTGAGGVEPTYYVSEDYRTNPPLGKDAVWIPTQTLDTQDDPVNDVYVTRKHILELIVSTTTSEDRLKELSDEVVRILNATAITGMTYQRIKRRKRVSGEYKGIWVYQEIITLDLREQMASSASAYGAGTTGDFAVVGELTVSTYNILDALMLGSANAAYVPMTLHGHYSFAWANSISAGWISNVGGDNMQIDMIMPIPCLKGSLKLYITNLKFGVADASGTDYITAITINGFNGNVRTQLDIDGTNHTAAGDKTFSGAVMPAAAIDVSSYQSVIATFTVFCTGANDMDFGNVRMECYYA